MKLEDLFDKQKTALTDLLGMPTRKIIEKLAKKDPKAALSLSSIELYTESEEAALQSAKVISRYNGDAARNIAQGLKDIAMYTRDKNKVINAAKIMSLDEILNAGIKNRFEELTQLAAYIEDKDAVIESAKVISKHKGDTAFYIAHGLKDIAKETGDKDAVIKAAKVISKYNGYTARDIAQRLNDIAKETGDKDAVIESAKVISRYNGDAVLYITQRLNDIAEETGDKDAVIESAKVISKHKGDAARNIAQRLNDIAEETGDKDAVIESAKVISRYNGEAAENISHRLGIIAIYTKDKSTLITACKITNLAGADVFDILTVKDLLTIKNKKLEDLINNKESFDAVAAYIKSGYKLPMPSKDNITNYKNIASEYISKIYHIKNSNLNLNQILMLFSVDKDKRRELADLINNSNEIGLKRYNIVAEETKRLKVDDKLPYLSLIAVTRSRNKDIDNEAYKRISGIVGEKAVRKARNEFSSHYKNKIKEIAAYVKKNEIDKAIDYLKSTKNEAIEDVLRCADYKDFGFTGGNTVLRAVESNNPLDYDNRVQIACVYLPNDYHDGIYNYCRDYYSKEKGDGFILIRYDMRGKALGSAICYMENNTFLVDSVEGHRTFRKPQIFNAVYQDLVDRAREKGAKRVIFSDGGINETPKKFIEFLEGLRLKRNRVKMKLNTEGYLEAEKSGVKGYIVNLD